MDSGQNLVLFGVFLLIYCFMTFLCLRYGGKTLMDAFNPKKEFMLNPFAGDGNGLNSPSPVLNRLYSFVIGSVLLAAGLYFLSFGVQVVINSLSKS